MNGSKGAARLRTLSLLGVLLAPAAGIAATADELIAEGDQHYVQARLADARQSYSAAVQAEPNRLAPLTRLIKAESELGELQSGDEQRRTWGSAVEHARASVRLAPDSARTHLWLAIALGRKALREGSKTKLALSKEIKSEVDKAIELDPTMGRAYHVRAVWNVKVSSLNTMERMAANTVLGGVPKGASWENAERDFQKAIQLEPDYINHRLEYARMLRERGRKADARRELEKAVSLPVGGSALDGRYQKEARELLGKLKG